MNVCVRLRAMQAGHAGTSGSDGVTDPQQQDNGHLEEEPEEAVEWTRKMVRTHFKSQLSTTFSKEEVEEYIMMLASTEQQSSTCTG